MPKLTFALRRLLGAFEESTTTDNITGFFAPGGALILGGTRFTGAEAILAAREAILPPDGSIKWNVCIIMLASRSHQVADLIS